MKYFIIITIFLIGFGTTNILAQISFKIDSSFFDFSKYASSPAIRLDYGSCFSSLSQNNKKTLTNSLYSLSADLGLTSYQDFFTKENEIDTLSKEEQDYNSILSSNSFWGVNLSYINLNNKINNSNLTSIFMLSPTDIGGVMYKLSDNLGIKILTGSNISWYWVNYSELDYNVENDDSTFIEENNYADISVFGSSVRFGNKYQSEIQLQIYKSFSIYGNAQRLVIFPRTMFWKYLGSEVIFSISNRIVRYFTNKLKTSNPYINPIIDFIIRTGLNYGFTELQRKKMNWPFNTASPLIVDQFRVGLQLEF